MENKKEEETKTPLRQIVIETDGDMIHIVSADVSGILEFKAIIQTILDNINSGKISKK